MSVHRQAQVLHENDVETRWEGGCWMQWTVDQRLGAEHLMSFLCQVDKGGGSAPHSHAAEEVVFVLDGGGEVSIEGLSHRVEDGDAMAIPSHAEHFFGNFSPAPFRLAGAMAPPIGLDEIRPALPRIGAGTSRSAPRREAEIAPTLMGERSFRVLAGPETDCRQITQFTGLIPPGRAPLHAHPHEESVYILAGKGRLWVEDEHAGELRPGSVIFIPIGVRHTLENTSQAEILKVLGTFSPAGSPAAKLPQG